MATYGKKRRGLLSTFSVFHDDKPKVDTDGKHFDYKKVRGLNADARNSTYLTPHIEDSIDELADALLEDTPQNSTRASFTRNNISPGKMRPQAGTITPDDLNKPLPSLPKEGLKEQRRPGKISKKALLSKSTNLKVAANGLEHFRPKISNPILQTTQESSADRGTHASPGKVQIVRTAAEALGRTNTAAAADLSKRISALMQEAALAEKRNASARNEAIGAHRSTAADKPVRIRRGKEAFARAKQAIANQFSSSGEKQGRKRDNQGNSLSSSLNDEEIRENDSDREPNRQRLDRRIAEGANLSNPKIRSLTGDGHVRRKPLSVYESMKSPTRQFYLTDDPFLDDNRMGGGRTSPDFTSFDFDFGFDTLNERRSSELEPISFPAGPYPSNEPSGDEPSAEANATSRFSNMLSGLKQHPDTECFSSSPLGHSTPCVRLEPQFIADGKKKLSSVHARSPMILDLSFEDQSQDDLDKPRQNVVGAGGLSLKRKTAKDNLRATTSSVQKRVKKGSEQSIEEKELATGLAELNTHEAYVLSVKDKNKRLKRAATVAAQTNGLKIFETGKGKAKMSNMADVVKRARERPVKGKQLSVLRPVGKSLSHPHRASTSMLGGMADQDSSSIDELQMDDSAHQIGTRRA
ncbi:hypothetical protein MMC24_003414 [Lignoscripta atroalba]|nr:hypothetical protein [Lignoscripta atroalba]